MLGSAPAMSGERMSGPGFEGVVIVEEGPGRWTPTRREIEELERTLPADTSAAWSERKVVPKRLSEYKRQYVGLGHGKKRTIHVTFLHNSTSSVRSGAWLQRSILVAGGFDMYLSAEYDPDAKVLLSLSVNSQR